MGELYETDGMRIELPILYFSGTNYHDDKFPSITTLPRRFKEYEDYVNQKSPKNIQQDLN